MAPDAQSIFQTLDATWPSARTIERKGWTLREGKGGGQRVSAATCRIAGSRIYDAEQGMVALGQRPLFMIRPEDASLDRALSEREYEVVDPVTIYAVESAEIARAAEPAETIEAWPPLAIQAEIWAEGGVGPARLDVMHRSNCPRTTLLGRLGDRAAATVYVGCSEGIAMLHALETKPVHRRQGVGRRLMHAAAHWASRNGAPWLVLAVVTANAPANALYQSLGMSPVTTYHYRRAKESAA